jgi:hypothetical protein
MDDAPFMLTVGVDVPASLRGDELDGYIQARAQIHMPESVESHPGFMRGTVYQRVGPAQAINDWPETLTILEIDSAEAADGFVDRLLKGPRGYPAYRRWTDVDHAVRWRVLWQRRLPAAGQLTAGTAPYLRLTGYRDSDSVEADLKCQAAPHPVVRALHYFAGTSYSLMRNLAESGEIPHLLGAYPAREVTTFDAAPEEGPRNPKTEATEIIWDCVYRRISSYVRAALM